MNRFTIYCTEEQTKKALELGAPIELWKGSDDVTHPNYINLNIQDHAGLCSRGYVYAVIPTVEQMISWLETQMNISSIEIDIEPRKTSSARTWRYFIYDWENDDIIASDDKFNSRPEATLAAIDAALEYLSNNDLTKTTNS